jgi:diguanylate cyclase (GGDEF)-like protein
LFLIGALLIDPACSGMIAVRAMHFIGGVAFIPAFRAWMLGHAVGLVAILPFSVTAAVRLSQWGAFFDRRQGPGTASVAGRSKALISVLMLATMVLLNVCVFMQEIRWPLVAPLLFALFAAVWADTLVATAMPVLVALIGAPLTIAGLGPIAPGLLIASDHLQLGIVYAGLVACCSLPVVVEQARRRQEIARLSHSAAHFQAMSQRADNLIDELRRTAMTDALTGLPNRRAFFEALEEQAMSSEPACLAMIDIDHFKLVNDRFGHAAGDAVLCQFSDIARKSFRGSDMVARIGGEEFAVILRGIDMVQACQVCQRLVDRFAATDISTTHGTVRVTISSGLATIGDDGMAVMAAADQALYEAKRGGRSRLSAAA